MPGSARPRCSRRPRVSNRLPCRRGPRRPRRVPPRLRRARRSARTARRRHRRALRLTAVGARRRALGSRCRQFASRFARASSRSSPTPRSTNRSCSSSTTRSGSIPASIDAIGFALHRIESDPIVALVAVRAHEDGAFDPAPFAVLELDGLDGTTAAELLGRRAPIQAEVAEACVTSVGGNPLALLELDRTLDAAQREAADLSTTRHRSAPRSADWSDVGSSRSPPTAAPHSCSSHSARRSRRRSRAPRAARTRLRRARRARTRRHHHSWSRSWSSRTRCSRAAALDGVEPAQRRRTHRMLANAFAAAGDEDRAAWHLGSAADGPDDRRRGRARSGRRTRSRARRGHRRGCGIRARGAPDGGAGRPGPATLPGRSRRRGMPARPMPRRQLLREAVSDADPQHRAGVRVPAGHGDRLEHRHACRHRALARGGRTRRRRFPREAVALLSGASALLSMQGQLHGAIELGDRAVEVAERSDELARLGALGTRAIARLTAGDRRAEADLAPLDALIRPLPFATVPDLLDSIQLLAFTQMLREMWEEGRATLDRLASAARQLGLVGVLGFASAIHADIDWRIGHWAHARATPPSTSNRTPRASPATPSSATRSSRASRRDSASTSRPDTPADAALAQSRRIGMQMLEIWARAALGFLAVTRADFGRRGRTAGTGLAHARGGIGRRSRSAVVAGRSRRGVRRARSAQGRDSLAPVPGRADRGPRGADGAAGIEARLRGLIEEDEHAAGAAFRQFGSALRRARQRPSRRLVRACSPPSSSASTTRRGPWASSNSRPRRSPRSVPVPGSARAQRARSQPSASVIRATSVAGKLTRAELRVAVEIASGRTNREIAEHLFVEPAHRRCPLALDLSQARRAHSHRARSACHCALKCGTPVRRARCDTQRLRWR